MLHQSRQLLEIANFFKPVDSGSRSDRSKPALYSQKTNSCLISFILICLIFCHKFIIAEPWLQKREVLSWDPRASDSILGRSLFRRYQPHRSETIPKCWSSLGDSENGRSRAQCYTTENTGTLWYSMTGPKVYEIAQKEICTQKKHKTIWYWQYDHVNNATQQKTLEHCNILWQDKRCMK